MQNVLPREGEIYMNIIDTHFHIWPALCGLREGKYITKAEGYGKVRRIGQRIERWIPPSFVDTVVSPEVALEYMEMAGINKAVLLQAPCYGNNNEYLSSIIQKYPKKFVAIALVDPRENDQGVSNLEEAICKLGLKGVKFELPDYPFHPDEQKYEALWRKILEFDIPVVFDMGWGESEYDFQLAAMKHLVTEYPEMKVIIAHLGVSRLWDPKQDEPFPVLQETLYLANLSQNVWFDLAGLPALCEEEEYPYPRAQRAIKVAYETLGAKRLMWGSDFPTILLKCTYQQTVDLIKKHCTFISDEDKKIIFSGNAEEVFFN